MSIHLEATLSTSPEALYALLADGRQFAAATGQPAQITPAEGSEFSVFGGRVHGRQIELLPAQRIVQAWRGNDWEAGVFSVVTFTLIPCDQGTKLVIYQDAYPQGKSPLYPTWHEHLSAGCRV